MDEDRREEAYRLYVANSLQGAPQGRWLVNSLAEILDPPIINSANAEEIAQDIIARMGLNTGGETTE